MMKAVFSAQTAILKYLEEIYMPLSSQWATCYTNKVQNFAPFVSTTVFFFKSKKKKKTEYTNRRERGTRFWIPRTPVPDPLYLVGQASRDLSVCTLRACVDLSDVPVTQQPTPPSSFSREGGLDGVACDATLAKPDQAVPT
ncbi:hypothetical protein B0T24DRAFT_629021 [Lasiosphaeria ovina]|uniref:Uncharacterized protein n=1 Tax=Lasiosphaeria ovina TaxID=92902 RepID=A0AAE0K7R1_9PEZI|nr:hypothetical protein B0T24DRAFT_629021 [Lasiosphaeria ovina]